jgi:two-component system, OmpR family, phosphate regulon response regulator PhoB
MNILRDAGFRSPHVLNFSLNIKRSTTSKLSVKAAYSGHRGSVSFVLSIVREWPESFFDSMWSPGFSSPLASERSVGYEPNGMPDTVLVVEDEADVADLLRYNLSKAGFSVLIARDGLSGLELARKNRPEIIVLDLMLPGMDGNSVCKSLKKDPETQLLPILMLTARGETSERIHGLEIGADDYVTKPFSPRELVLRIQALLRRSRSKVPSDVLEVGHFHVDRNKFDVRLEGRRLDLTTTEFKLLTVLIERRGRTQSRERLLYDVWGYQNPIDTRTVDTHIRRLREKLGKHSSKLETVRGEGYRFNAASEP